MSETPDRHVEHGGPVEWPPRSPDFNRIHLLALGPHIS